MCILKMLGFGIKKKCSRNGVGKSDWKECRLGWLSQHNVNGNCLFLFFFLHFFDFKTIDDWLDSMNGRYSIVKRSTLLSAVSYFDDKYFCDCVNCSTNCRPVCRCYKLALLSVAYEHFECDVLIVSAMINSYCMDRIGNLRRVMQRPWVALRQPPQQQQQTQHYDDDSNRLIDSALMWTSVVLLWRRSSDDLTTSNKDDVISPKFFFFDLIWFVLFIKHFVCLTQPSPGVVLILN